MCEGSFLCILILFVCNIIIIDGHTNNLAWSGGPLHIECEHSAELWTKTGQYIRENVIATKAFSFKDDIYVITPRLKSGVLATVWLVVRGRRGVELQPFPNIATHTLADCAALQNAVDFQFDHLGNLWVLDIGIIETAQSPRCTCPPKIVVISSTLGKVTKHIELSSLTEPTSQLQNLVIEYGLGGKTYVYVSDASRGAILVHDVSTSTGWLVLACAPAVGIQIALVKPFITHPVLIITRLYHQGVFELDTAVLKRRNSVATLRVFGENTKPVLLLGSDMHHVYVRHVECSDVLSWDTRQPYNASTLINMHSAGPRLTPTSVTADPKKHVILVLDSNYGDTIYSTIATYQRITFIGQL
ncbi:uncharacterized protein [Epargyreus clarus]|uniref:uncharacterized protein n=1 Tax=Epargyreus clarus TaxID=520877 RepID=UPI003C2DDABF